MEKSSLARTRGLKPGGWKLTGRSSIKSRRKTKSNPFKPRFPSKTERAKKRREETQGTAEYRAWLRAKPCLCHKTARCGPMDLAHVKPRSKGGKWKDQIPLCRHAHAVLDDRLLGKTWQERAELCGKAWGVDLAAQAEGFVREYENR